jgi:hypothetical protein
VLLNYYLQKREYFGTLPPRTTKINREIITDSNTAYSVNGNYQSSLSPRFINTNVGANIRYSNSNVMVAPSHPTTNVERIHQEYRPRIIDPPNSVGSSRNASRLLNERHIQMDNPDNRVTAMQKSQREYLNVVDLLPVTDNDVLNDTMRRQGADIQVKIDEQPIIYDRFMFANSKSNLRGRSDPFRGDLPIVPILPQASADSGVWFRPSVAPHIDLGRGYLSVAGGFDNESNNKLKNLMIASSGGTFETFGGNNVQLQRSIINNSSGDLMVSAFV